MKALGEDDIRRLQCGNKGLSHSDVDLQIRRRITEACRSNDCRCERLRAEDSACEKSYHEE